MIKQLTCDGCGACCLDQGSPPMYLWYLNPGVAQTDDPDCIRVASLPPDALKSLLDYRERLMSGDLEEGPCCWYDPATKGCRHYEHRPDICREFEVGGDACHGWRKLHQIGVIT